LGFYPGLNLGCWAEAHEEVVQRRLQNHLPNHVGKASRHDILPEQPFIDRERGLSHPPPPIPHPPPPGLRVPKLLHDSHFPGVAAAGPGRGAPPDLDARFYAQLLQIGGAEARIVCAVTQNPNHVATPLCLLHQRHQHPAVTRPLVRHLHGDDLLRLHVHGDVDLEEAPAPPPLGSHPLAPVRDLYAGGVHGYGNRPPRVQMGLQVDAESVGSAAGGRVVRPPKPGLSPG